MRKYSESYVSKLMSFEGFSPVAYKPKGEKWTKSYTIGYGHYGVLKGSVISESEALNLLYIDLDRLSVCLDELLSKYGLSLSGGKYDALLDFGYNIGLRALENSTLFKLIRESRGNKDFNPLICTEFMRWAYSGKTRLKGLERRCKYRCDLWLSE